jgi:hypothetical protein
MPQSSIRSVKIGLALRAGPIQSINERLFIYRTSEDVNSYVTLVGGRVVFQRRAAALIVMLSGLEGGLGDDEPTAK